MQRKLWGICYWQRFVSFFYAKKNLTVNVLLIFQLLSFFLFFFGIKYAFFKKERKEEVIVQNLSIIIFLHRNCYYLDLVIYFISSNSSKITLFQICFYIYFDWVPNICPLYVPKHIEESKPTRLVVDKNYTYNGKIILTLLQPT